MRTLREPTTTTRAEELAAFEAALANGDPGTISEALYRATEWIYDNEDGFDGSFVKLLLSVCAFRSYDQVRELLGEDEGECQ